MISFIDFLLNENKHNIAGKDKFEIPTCIKKSKSSHISKAEYHKAKEVLECIFYLLKRSSYDILSRPENKKTLKIFGYDIKDKSQWDDIIKRFIMPLTANEFSYDYKVNNRGTWVFEFVYRDFKNDKRFNFDDILPMQYEYLKNHLYIKFTFKYFGDDGYPVDRSHDGKLYINPDNVYLITISIHDINSEKA